MHILITGGTGLIGQQLCNVLHAQGHQITVLSRSPDSVSTKCGSFVKAISTLDEWVPEMTFNVVINLAGEPIADKFWSAKRKQLLWDSRVTLTEKLVSKIAATSVKPSLLLSGSAIGYYGNRDDEELDEGSTAGHGFAAELCSAWEHAALAAEQLGVRVCLLRTGLVLSNQGGILSKMRLPLGVGVRFGNGAQWMSWIHISDYVQIVLRLIADDQANGAFNMTAPQPVTNKNFTQILVNLQQGLTTVTAPAFLLKMLLGERAGLLSEGQRILPKKIQASSYTFTYPELSGALNVLLRKL
jgi:uncharacterized protein (TIGR01777 family)